MKRWVEKWVHKHIHKKIKKKERKKKTKMTKHDFHLFQVRHFNDHFEQSPCCCKMGQHQKADISVFGGIKFTTRRNITVWTLIHCMQLPFCFLGHPYIGSHYRASLTRCTRSVRELFRLIIEWNKSITLRHRLLFQFNFIAARYLC